MPSKPYPTRRRVLLAGALAATGFALDEAMAEPISEEAIRDESRERQHDDQRQEQGHSHSGDRP